MMKMRSLVSLMALACTVFALTARADELSDPQVPNIPQEVKLTPEMQATLAQLLKTLGTNQAGNPAPAGTAPNGNVDPAKVAPMISQLLKMLNSDNSDQNDDPKPAPHSEQAPTPSNGQKSQQTTGSTGLQTTSLHSGGLVTGTLGGTPRLTREQWRALFPIPHN
ncbi:hypothetical protein CfE428DRAFT_5293 [Chthoniobacter flavus Ellin428]|uniref:Secreted protein n=3 Tax=Chthoniobacter flavus TaxID=191863 RepID=B4D8Q3_9BACT|nr:hypothetical protein CfE428DRAFT_5293 [Chthoniobacter flavus Ellin428]TCO90229.1 hypothetical protein EV701_111155 [Chthoniobacter flavus]